MIEVTNDWTWCSLIREGGIVHANIWRDNSIERSISLSDHDWEFFGAEVIKEWSRADMLVVHDWQHDVKDGQEFYVHPDFLGEYE